MSAAKPASGQPPGGGRQRSLEVRIVARPTGPVETVREYALDAAYRARALVQGLAGDFSRSDRFVKYKIGIIGLWALVSAATLVATCTGGRSDIDVTNAIGAYARFERSAELGVAAVFLENHSRDTWKQVQLTINDTYSSLLPYVDPGGRAVVELKKFNGPKGETPPQDTRVARLAIRCSEGTAVLDLGAAP